MQKTTPAVTEQYYYSGSRVVVETNINQAVTKEYIHGGLYIDEVITVTNSAATYFYLHDLRFNVYGLTDINGNVVERARYEGFGKYERLDLNFTPTTTSIVDQPHPHTGQRYDPETGLQYFRLRYYDADLGRFISRNPIGYVDGMSLYRGYFVLNGVDFMGLVGSDRLITEAVIKEATLSIKKNKGFRDTAYKDSEGHLTIGYGTKLANRNKDLEDLGYDYEKIKKGTEKISNSDAEKIMKDDIEKAQNGAQNAVGFDCWDRLDPAAQAILLEMVYQMGQNGVQAFRNMISALCGESADYKKAGEEMLKSKWNKQTPNRCKSLSDKMKSIEN